MPERPDNAASERAKALLIPVSEATGPAGGHVAPVLPGRPDPKRPTMQQVGTGSSVGGAPCQWCATPNPVDRHFCRRCAMNLAENPVTLRRPWWRRLVDLRRRPVPFAGQRPRLRRGPRGLVRWAVWGVVVLVVVIVVDKQASTVTMNVTDHFAKPTQTDAYFTGSTGAPNHGPTLLSDSYNNTYWQCSSPGDCSNTVLTATFGGNIDLLDIAITPGTGTDYQDSSTTLRPDRMLVTLVYADGHTTTSTISLGDSSAPAIFRIRGNDVKSVQFQALSAHDTNATSGAGLAIADIEFFARNTAGVQNS